MEEEGFVGESKAAAACELFVGEVAVSIEFVVKNTSTSLETFISLPACATHMCDLDTNYCWNGSDSDSKSKREPPTHVVDAR